MTRDNTELTEAIANLDIEAWMDREGVTYRKARGKSGMQLHVKECPCCGNSKFKVYINAETGLGNCFAGDCEVKYNKWSFIKAFLGVDNKGVVDHIKAVAKEQGWRPPKITSAPVETDSDPVRLPVSFPLPLAGRSLKYLANRGINDDLCRYFHLRLCQRGTYAHQDYSKRVIIPVFDLEGQLVTFQGRDITGTAEQKYLFPPGLAGTGEHLYNGHNAVGAARIVIGEGAFDVMATKIALDADMALRDVVPVGSFGKHLSEGGENSQLAKLLALKERGLREVTFLWDGEPRAYQDAVKAALLVHSIGLVARVARLPEDKDPNEVAPEVVRQAFWQARVVTPATAVSLRLQPMKFVGSFKISHP